MVQSKTQQWQKDCDAVSAVSTEGHTVKEIKNLSCLMANGVRTSPMLKVYKVDIFL